MLLAQPLTALDKEPLRLAIHDLATSHGERYPKAQEFLDRLERVANADELESLRREALLANPRLDFGPLMYVRRDATSPKLGLPQNWQGNCSLPRAGYRDSISVIEEPLKGGTQRVLFQPQKPLMIADVDLHFDGQRMLFSMIGSHNRWQIWEIRADGGGLRQVTAGDDPEVDNYDPCYLPDGKIIFYPPWQRVHNAGFRVAIKIPDTPAPTTAAK